MRFVIKTTAAIDGLNDTNGFANINKTIDVTPAICATVWVNATDVTVRPFCFPVRSALVLSAKAPASVTPVVVEAIVRCSPQIRG